MEGRVQVLVFRFQLHTFSDYNSLSNHTCLSGNLTPWSCDTHLLCDTGEQKTVLLLLYYYVLVDNLFTFLNCERSSSTTPVM